MKISNINTYNINSLSFCKKIVATCDVKDKDKNNEKCNIYQLDKKEDAGYFLRLEKKQEWDGAKFLAISSQLMLSPLLSDYITPYVIEKKNGECLGYISVFQEDEKKEARIQYLETCPEHSSNNKERQIKYVGESLMAFIVGLAEKESLDRVCVPIYSTSAKPFYYWKCCFRENGDKKDGLILEEKNYSKFLERHNKKIGSKIEYTA